MNKNEFYIFKERTEWRAWLEVNHKTANEIWLGYYKKHTGKKSISYNDAVEEALCYGWIDSLVKRVDENIYKQKYTPRKKNSVWSIINVNRVEKMIKVGKMTSYGMEKVKEAKQNGKWDIAYGTQKEESLPEDLLCRLRQSELALKNFFNFTQSIRNRYIYWINNAKKEETRTKRIQIVFFNAEKNIKP